MYNGEMYNGEMYNGLITMKINFYQKLYLSQIKF